MKPAGSDGGWGVVEWAFHRPDEVADEWRRRGGQVVGVVGASVPVELLSAAGLLPIRLAPSRLPDLADGGPDAAADVATELPPPARRILLAWWTGSLAWLDGLVVGRDRESDSLLFAALRELDQGGTVSGRPRVAGYDLLRLQTTASARYNLQRGMELLALAGEWSGHYPEAIELARTSSTYMEAMTRLAAVSARRTAREGGMPGSRALMLAAAAAVLPVNDLATVLDAIARDRATASSPSAPCSVWLSGSAIEDPLVYEHLERFGLIVVGEDHEWAPSTASGPVTGPRFADEGAAADIEALVAEAVGRRSASMQGSARRGLAERVAYVVEAATRAHASTVLQVSYDHDPAPRWERPALAAALVARGLRLRTVRLDWETAELTALDTVASDLLAGCDVGS